jgi:hypothetical protein
MFCKLLQTRHLRSRARTRLLAAAAPFCLSCQLALVQAEPQLSFRDWTNPNGETIRARLEGLVNGRVQLRQLNDRSFIELKFQALSPEDQAYVDKYAHLVSRRDTVSWPKHLRPARDFQIDEFQAGRNYRYNTRHFSLLSDVRLAPELIGEYALVFESIHYVLESLPLGLQPEAPTSGRFKVRLFRRHDDFQQAGGDLESAAIYLKDSREILIPLASLGVNIVGEQVPLNSHTFNPTPLKHEVTHQLMHDWLSFLPIWFNEGMAEYVSALQFSDGEFDFTRIDQDIKAHLQKKYRIKPSDSGEYLLDVLPPEKLMANSANWRQASGAAAELNYCSAFLLIYYFIHLDGGGNASNLVEYLRTARMERDLQAEFVKNYNETLNGFNAQFSAWKEDAKRYNEALLKHREQALAYNQRVDRYNEQILAKVPTGQLIDPGPEPVPPSPPKKPALPEILRQNPKDRFPLNLTQVEERARAQLMDNRSCDQLWNQMKSALGRQKLIVNPAGGTANAEKAKG